jgi:hypothetical protein
MEKVFQNLTIRAVDPDAVYARTLIEWEEVRKRNWLMALFAGVIQLPQAWDFANIYIHDPRVPDFTIEEFLGPIPLGTGTTLGVYYALSHLIQFSAQHDAIYHVIRYELFHFFYRIAYNEDIFKLGSAWGNITHGNAYDPMIQFTERWIDIMWEGLVGHQYRPRLVYGSTPLGSGLIDTPLGPAHTLTLEDHHE